MMEILTDQERAVQLNLTQIWEMFKDLPEQHEVDTTQFYLNLTNLQRIVCVRGVRRLEGLAPEDLTEKVRKSECNEKGCPVEDWLTGKIKLTKGGGMLCSKCGLDYTGDKWIKMAQDNFNENKP